MGVVGYFLVRKCRKSTNAPEVTVEQNKREERNFGNVFLMSNDDAEESFSLPRPLPMTTFRAKPVVNEPEHDTYDHLQFN